MNTSSEDSTTVFQFSDLWPYKCDRNDIACLNDRSYYNTSQSKTTNVTSSNSSFDVDTGSFRYWTLFLLLLPIFTVFGNVLVCMSVYRERSLRTATNHFICSLAIADLMIAVAVMSVAVYMEFTQYYWSLSCKLCDAWIATDVMACTASVLNLTAISVDRYIAVTRPIRYSKHKKSKLVFVLLALTWVISALIAAPIVLGVNFSERRQAGACAVFNSDFLVYSSVGSFYIPSIIIMIFLYCGIYRVFHLRARVSMAHTHARQLKKHMTSKVTEKSAIINAFKPEPTVTTGLATSMDNGKISTYNSKKCQNQLALPIPEDEIVTNIGTNTDSQSSERYNNEDEKSPESIDGNEDDENDNEGRLLIVNPIVVKQIGITTVIEGNGNGTCITPTETDTRFDTTATCRKMESQTKNDYSVADYASRKMHQTRTTTNFNVHMRTSRKRKEKSFSKREKKATKTLAIVLGVFLFCWMPFFTTNIINAICIKYDLFSTSSICNVDIILFSFFVWLGYINCFLKPIIYTIFNPGFRKAFERILTPKCH